MLTTKEISSRKRVFKLVSKMLCLLAMVIIAVYLNGTRTAHATSRFSCALGGGTFISCGSSAGNFTYNCDSSGVCVTPDYNVPGNQEIANERCEQYERDGCPGQLFGDGEAQIEGIRQ